MFICFEGERGRWSMSGGGAEREGDTESKVGSRIRAVSTEPNMGLEPTSREIMTWAEIGHLPLSHPGAPTFIYFWERETEHKWGRGREREGDTESEAASRLWAVSTEPGAGLKPTNCEIMAWAKVGCSTNWATQVPLKHIFKKIFLSVLLTCHIENGVISVKDVFTILHPCNSVCKNTYDKEDSKSATCSAWKNRVMSVNGCVV